MKTVGLRQFRRTSVVVVLFSALCLALGTAAPSLAAGAPGRAHPDRPSAPPDGMSWHVYHLMMAQLPLDAAATRIQALAARPGPAHRGFFETAVNDSRQILTVYWHGPVPANVQRLIGRLRATVDLRVVLTRYSLAALNRDVLTAINSDGGVVGGYPLTGGSGIGLSVHSSSARLVASVASAMRSRLGVPVVATSSGPAQPQYCAQPKSHASLGPGSRCYDLENFWGGDVIQQRADPGFIIFCSGGFGVHNPAGGEYLMTAAHCAYNGSLYVNGISFHNGQDPQHWQGIGAITDVSGPHDWAAIPAGTGDQVYYGPGIFNGDTKATRTVAGQHATSVGDSLCESGAFSGLLCGFTVSQLNYSYHQTGPSQTWTALALATSGTGQWTVAGDSGGPWFSLDGSTHVWAMGIHHGLLENSADQPEYEMFTPVTVATSDNRLVVNTG